MRQMFIDDHRYAALVGVFVVTGLIMAAGYFTRPEAAGPVPEMQAGQTYEVWWSCDQTGCAVELATIVHVDKKRGYVLDTRGFWFKPDNAMAFRDARNLPARPQNSDHLPQIRAER